MARWLNRFRWLALLPLLASGPALHAQPNWRVFDQDTDGLAARNCTYLSLGPSGHLWIRHGDEPFLSRFNGYEVQRVPAPNPGPLPAATSFRPCPPTTR